MALFEVSNFDSQVRKAEEVVADKKSGSKMTLKKGQTAYSIIEDARRIVDEKLGKYKDTSRCVVNVEDLKSFFDETPDGSYIAIDTETTGLDTYKDRLVGVCLCNGIQAIYVPLGHISYITRQLLQYSSSNDVGQIYGNNIQMNPIEFKKLFCELLDTHVFKWIYHNAKFDLSVLRTFLDRKMPDPYWDTMLAAYLFNQTEEHSLKYLYNKYIAVEDEGVNRFDTLFKGMTFDYVPIDVATIYGGKDAFMTMELFKYQYEKMNTKEYAGVLNVMNNIEMPLLPILEDMQRTGVNLNMAMLNEFRKKYDIKLEEAKNKVYDEIKKAEDKIIKYRAENPKSKLDDPINLGSPSQLSILFYDILGYKLKSKGRGTGVNELEELNTDLTKALLDYRKAEKLIDAFLVALPKRISDSKLGANGKPGDGKIHTSLNQYGAATGRFSSSDPNLQQIPSRGEGKELRRLFGATKGYILMSSDFSQQEPRCLASLADDQKMIDAYIQGKDLYAMMASEIYKKPYEDCMEFYLDENGKKTDVTNPEGKKRRSSVKSILLGIMYGRGVASVAEQIHSTKEDAQRIIDDFYVSYPTIKEFTEEVQDNAKRDGYTTTAWGRRRYLDKIQLPPYTYKYNENRRIDFNPLFSSPDSMGKDVPESVKEDFNEKFEAMKTKSNFYDKQRKLIEKAKTEYGIDITSNQGDIAEALRQCLNGVIQGSSADMSKRAMILLGQNEELKQ